MSALLAQRQLSLAAAAVLGVVIALALAARDNPAPKAAAPLPRPAVSNQSAWYRAIAGVRSRPLSGHASGCGTLLSPKTLGLDHPVLPCAAKLFVEYHGKTVLTTVVDRGPSVPGREFEVTPALADLLGLSGVQTIRWSFTRGG